MTNLYEITAQFQKLLELEEYNLESSELLDKVNGDFEEKCNSVAKYILNLQAEAEAVKSRVTELELRRKRLNKKIEWLENYIIESMEKTGKSHIHSSPDVELRLKRNPPSVVVRDESLLDPKWFDYKPAQAVLSKTRLKEALQAGEVIEQAFLQQNSRIEIK